jgi:cytochrome P450
MNGWSPPSTPIVRKPAALGITLAEIESDPYTVFERLRKEAPIAWIEPLQMWWAVRYADVQTILAAPTSFTTCFETSTILRTFGAHMLTEEGAEQERFKASFRGAFAPAAVRHSFEMGVRNIARGLIEGFVHRGAGELRTDLASRLPILTILSVFGLPHTAEPQLRSWYDSFEHALANFIRDPTVAALAQANVVLFHELLQNHIDRVRGRGGDDLLSRVVNQSDDDRLSDDEIRRNASIIFFGGISTVEALILNSLYALCTHREVMSAVRADRSLIPSVIEEVLRWLSPVQSATRQVVRDIEIGGVALKAGDTINCMLGAANSDPGVFPEPDSFRLGRPEIRRHLAFAAGPHFCLGSHLAKLEGRIALELLLGSCSGLRLDPAEAIRIEGYEFRQPKRLSMRWQIPLSA